MTKPEPLTKEKIIAEKYENFFREQDVKSAVQGLLKDIEKRKKTLKEIFENTILILYDSGILLAEIEEIKNLVKEWFPDVVEDE